MWYIYEKRKMKYIFLNVLLFIYPVLPKYIETTEISLSKEDNIENNVIDFEEDYSVKFKNKYDKAPWHSNNFKKESHRYTIIKENVDLNREKNKYDTTTQKFNEKIVKSNPVEITIAKKLEDIVKESTPAADYSILPIELISTTDNTLVSIIESTTEADLSVIPLNKKKSVPHYEIKQTFTLPSTQTWDTSTEYFTTESFNKDTTTRKNNETTTTKREITTKSVETTTEFKTTENILSEVKTAENVSTNNAVNITETKLESTTQNIILNESPTTVRNIENKNNLTVTEKTVTSTTEKILSTTSKVEVISFQQNYIKENSTTTNITKVIVTKLNNESQSTRSKDKNKSGITVKDEIKRDTNKTKPTENKNQNQNNTKIDEADKTNSSKPRIQNRDDSSDDSLESDEKDIPVFTGLDTEDLEEVPEDYYDAKDVLPTTAPKTDAISVIFGLAGSVVESVVESVAEKVVPRGIYDLFKRMQKQSEALEAERLRSREENGGLGQFTRGIIKSISSGISKPLSQLMSGVKDIGSLDTDRGFVSSVAASVATGVSSVANVATSVSDAFKDRVQAIYPGTLWCGDGHSATARSGELGLFFFTDTCCRQHDACKIYIKAGDTKYGLTNTGLFTRSHCSCDTQFRECLRKTNSLVSAQIGITYFNVLGPQCFRKAHPIVKCVRRTRITGQKCEEYELDYTKPKMWQWFDNETY